MQPLVQFNVSLKTKTGVNLIPLDRLIIHEDLLELNATLYGNFIFQSGDIIAIKPIHTFLSVFGFNAFRIFHKVTGYPEEIGFLTTQKTNDILTIIEKTGLLNKGNDHQSLYFRQIQDKQKAGAFPMKKYVLLIAGLVFLLLIGLDFYRFATQSEVMYLPGPGLFSALVVFVIFCLLTLFFRPFQHLVIKKGRTLKDIDRHMYLYLFAALFILTINIYLSGFFFLY